MLRLLQWLHVFSRVASTGKSHGLSEAELGRALSRLIAATTTYAKQQPSRNSNQLLAIIQKNLNDNPMMIVWLLRLAAGLGNEPWRRFFDNFIKQTVADRRAILDNLTQKHGFPPPITLVVNPTMNCNLRCKGCYSFEFPRQKSMTPELFRKVMRESQDLGVRFITLTGGEPFAYPKLLDLVAEFNDLVFLTYTNGTLIDDRIADRIAEVGNLFPAFSVEGHEQLTDARRGQGVYQKVLDAMQRLRTRGVLFGISVTPTRQTAEQLCTDTFIDEFISRGANFVWMFSYIPVGRDPDLDLMPTPEQRDLIRKTTSRWRLERPIFIGDFWNDGAACGGCLSASRYAFVAPDGKVQPCTFVHFFTHDLNEHSLVEVFSSPFFQGIRDAQPYDTNLLRPCKIIDHPDVLRRLVRQHRAKPSYPGAESIIEDASFRSRLDAYSRAYGKLAEKAWNGPDYQGGKRALVPFSGYVDMDERFPDRMANARRVCACKTRVCNEIAQDFFLNIESCCP